MLFLKYNLYRYEIEESLLCINFKREGNFKKINIYIMCFVGFLLLLIYMFYNKNIFLLYFVFMINFTTLFILYVPSMLRKLKSNKIISNNNNYELQINHQGIHFGNDKFLSFNGVNLLESENIYTIKSDHHVFCIPKRIFKHNEIEIFKTIVKNNHVKHIQLRTKEGGTF